MYKKKVLMLVPDLQNKGPIIVMKSIVMSLKDEFQFYVCSLRKNSLTDLREYASENIEVFELNCGRIPDRKNMFDLERIISDYKIDIIHVHCFWPTIVGSLLKKDIKKIVTVHNNPFEDYIYTYGKIIGYIAAYVQQFCLKQYSVVAISKFVSEQLKKHHLIKDVRVIYNGIPVIDKAKKRTSGCIEIINISMLSKLKDVERTVKIFKHLCEISSGYHLSLVGDGPEKRKIEKLVREEHLEDKVTIWGKVPAFQVQELLAQSDIFLFTSKSEGFGLAIIEAMRQKVVPVVNDIPVMKEIIAPDGGFICRNDTEFLEKITELANEKVLEKKKKAAYIQFLRNFTVEQLAKDYKEEYLK